MDNNKASLWLTLGPYRMQKMKSAQKHQAVKKGAAFKSLGANKSYEINGGGQEMAAMILIAVHY